MLVQVTQDFKDKAHRKKLRKKGDLLEVSVRRGNALVKAGVAVKREIEMVEDPKK